MKTLPYPLSYKTIDGVEWEYISTGKGKDTIVILPGGAQTDESNFRFIRAFEDNYREIVLTIHNLDSTQEFNIVLNKILDTEKAQKVILYGLSMGGVLAQTFARDNPNRVKALIISHSCTPNSQTYKREIIVPLKLVKMALPIISDWLIRFISRFAAQIQGVSKSDTTKYFVPTNEQDSRYYQMIMQDYYRNFLDKRLLQTTIRIHLDFFKQELNPEDFSYLKRKVLILRTDNDRLMQDDGDFKRVYPAAQVHTFLGTGHLSFYYQMEKMVEVIKVFLTRH